MAEPKTSAPKIEYRHNVGKEQHELGVRTGGYFVPFVTVSDAQFASLVENAKNTSDATAVTEEEDE